MDHFSPSAACAEFAADLSYDSIPPEALDLIRRDILDWTGCALAGSRDRAAVPIQKTAELLGGKAEASVFGNRDKTDLRTAAKMATSATSLKWMMSTANRSHTRLPW